MIFVVANVDSICAYLGVLKPSLFIELNISVSGICHGQFMQLMFYAFRCGPLAIKIPNFRVLSTQEGRLGSEIQAAA
jgi:hypothetical protein